MGVAEKQHGAVRFKAPVGIMDFAFTRCQTYFIKILTAVHARRITILLDLKDIKSFQLQIVVEFGYRTLLYIFHITKLRIA
jgi:hypothetical protein